MHIDLKSGVAPISFVASHLAAMLKQAAKTGGPIVVTQKGRPTGVLLSVEAYERLIGQKRPTIPMDDGELWGKDELIQHFGVTESGNA